jgi:hypothetical protein
MEMLAADLVVVNTASVCGLPPFFILVPSRQDDLTATRLVKTVKPENLDPTKIRSLREDQSN